MSHARIDDGRVSPVRVVRNYDCFLPLLIRPTFASPLEVTAILTPVCTCVKRNGTPSFAWFAIPLPLLRFVCRMQHALLVC